MKLPPSELLNITTENLARPLAPIGPRSSAIPTLISHCSIPSNDVDPPNSTSPSLLPLQKNINRDRLSNLPLTIPSLLATHTHHHHRAKMPAVVKARHFHWRTLPLGKI